MNDDFKYHDNIDRDVIQISKDSLRLRLEDCAKYASLPAETVGYGSIAITLFAAAFLSETTRNLWVISGDTIKAAFLVGGVTAGYMAMRKSWRWYHEASNHDPEAIVNSLSPKESGPVAFLPEKTVTRKPLGRTRVTNKNVTDESQILNDEPKV